MKISEIWEKFELYILSLWLLFFLIIVVTADIPTCFGEKCDFIGWKQLVASNVIPIVSLAFLLLGAFYYFRFDYRISGSKRLSVKIEKVEDLNYEHLTFLTTYIIPLICFNLESTRYVFSLMFLLIIIGIIYVKTDKFYANPTLAVLGYRLYKVTVSTRTTIRQDIVVITKDRLLELDQIRILELDEKVYFVRKIGK
ncbi:anti-phage protein KwaA [Cellvibrio sp. ARAG 10.3]|uniref:anti-phage protein KwaA n=1 Tax=Cellvibrio sp. ARAG 10.3 TaxID=3451358 RepID=UPI003F460861